MSTAQHLIRVEEATSSYPVVVRPITTTGVSYLPQARPQALTRKQLVGYSLLIAALGFGGLQAVRCAVDSAVRLDNLFVKQAAVAHMQTEARTTNSYLKDKISLYRSPLGIEEMARERLNLVGQDEVLVRVFPGTVAQAPEAAPVQ